MNRREALQRLSVAGTLSLTAGCLTRGRPGSGGTTPPETTTESAPVDSTGEVEVLSERPPEDDPDCSELDPIRRPNGSSFPREAAGLELTVSTDSVAIGEDITFSLRNHNDEETLVGTLHKYNIERRDGDAWRPVFYSPDREYYDVGVNLSPGGGYDWPFTFDREGLEREQESPRVSYHVCSAVEPGTYRFAFWGLAGAGDAVAVTFTVEEA